MLPDQRPCYLLRLRGVRVLTFRLFQYTASANRCLIHPYSRSRSLPESGGILEKRIWRVPRTKSPYKRQGLLKIQRFSAALIFDIAMQCDTQIVLNKAFTTCYSLWQTLQLIFELIPFLPGLQEILFHNSCFISQICTNFHQIHPRKEMIPLLLGSAQGEEYEDLIHNLAVLQFFLVIPSSRTTLWKAYPVNSMKSFGTSR